MDNIKEQVALYFNTLHRHNNRKDDGKFQYSPQKKMEFLYAGNIDFCISDISRKLNKYKNNSIFTTLNRYKKISNQKNLRHKDNLWAMDCIMIDIDGGKKLCGTEKQAIDVLKWAWEHQKIPQPNLVSITGCGGIHLYYTFEWLPRSMYQSIQALKWSLVELIVPYEKDMPFREDTYYQVDTKILDGQRMDRVPGSINPKTGNRCICFATGRKRYQYKELLNYFCDDERWSGKVRIQQARRYIEKERNGSGIKKPNHKVYHKNSSYSVQALARQRIRKLFLLAENGKKFNQCREMACFCLRVWCRQAGYTAQKETELLEKINSYFYEPLSETELIYNTKSKKDYSFTNQYLAIVLHFTDEETKIFFSRFRPGNRKQKTIEHKVQIAKLVIKGYTIKEIATKLGISESIVKRRRSEIKKGKGFSYWANYLKKIYKISKRAKGALKKRLSFLRAKKSSFCQYISISLILFRKMSNRFWGRADPLGLRGSPI